jgi:hypothetical protein
MRLSKRRPTTPKITRQVGAPVRTGLDISNVETRDGPTGDSAHYRADTNGRPDVTL